MLKNLLIESGYPKKIGLGEAAIDAVIDPQFVKQYLIASLQMLAR